MRSLTTGVLLVLAAAVPAGCGRNPVQPPAAAAPEAAETAGGPAYAVPPSPTGVTSARSGAVTVHGRAARGVRVRGVSPQGAAYGATAGDDGAFALDLPPAATPHLLALSSEDGIRSIPGEGWLFVPPDQPGRAVLLRSGAPATPLKGAASLIAAVDYDAAGAVAVSGIAAPGARVQIFLDGAEAGVVKAGADGTYGARLARRVSPGAHLIRAAAGGRSAEQAVSLTPGGAVREVLSARREPEFWRVTWSPAGGGVQTTLVPVPVVDR
jgi:hypothetical protein